MNLLIVTDSNSSSLSSSFFALLAELLHNGIKVYILDKCKNLNKDFFCMKEQKKLFCHEICSVSNSYSLYIKERKNTKAFTSNDFTTLWMRLDPPVTDKFLQFIQTTFLNTLMINSPQGIIETSSKEFLLNYLDICPEMKLCSSIKDIESFAKKFPIVIKPLNDFGGNGLCRLNNDIGYIEDHRTSAKKVKSFLKNKIELGEKFLAVKFLKNITKGDKRVLVVNSKIVGVLNRIPSNESWLANLSQGATSEITKISDMDKKVASILSTDLLKKGISVFGFDMILDDSNNGVLSEINTLNVGGFSQVKEYGFPNAITESSSLIIEHMTTANKTLERNSLP